MPFRLSPRRSSLFAVPFVVAATLVVGTLVVPETAEAAEPVIFSSSGCSQWTVPSGWPAVRIDATGAAGEASSYFPDGTASGLGAGVTGTLRNVSAGDTLTVCVDVGGGAGGYGGPNSAYAQGGAGGGASGVSIGADFSNPVIVAGGGGGGASVDWDLMDDTDKRGGDAGGAAGSSGESNRDPFGNWAYGGEGGQSTRGGFGGAVDYWAEGGDLASVGGDGTVTTASGPGVGGTGATRPTGEAPNYPTQPFFGAGGGGGGYTGGGGGSAVTKNGWYHFNELTGTDDYYLPTSAGGGGSSYCGLPDWSPYAVGSCGTSLGAGTSTVAGAAEGQARVVLSPVFAPTVTIERPIDKEYGKGLDAPTVFTCEDGQGGRGIVSCLDEWGNPSGASRLMTSSVGDFSYSVTAISESGLSTTVVVEYSVIQALAPSVTVASPTADAYYGRDAVVAASFSCAEGAGGPGLVSCDSTVPDGSPIDTSSSGRKQFFVVATSADELSATAAFSYLVVDPPEEPIISSPVGGSSFVYGEVVTATWSCTPGAVGYIVSCVDGSGNVSGSSLFTGSIGSRTLSVTATDQVGQDATASVGYTVTPAPLRVQAPHSAGLVGDPVPGHFAPTYVGLVNGDAAPAFEPTCTTTATSSSPAGTYPIACSGLLDVRYDKVYVEGTFELFDERPPLTIAAPDVDIVEGDAVPSTFVPTLIGLVGDDTATDTPAVCSSTATALSGPGTYSILCSGAEDSLYSVAYEPGVLRILESTVVSTDDVTFEYGDTIPSQFSPIYGDPPVPGWVPTTPATCSTTATSASPPGIYAITCSGADEEGYAFSYVAASLQIVPKVILTITPGPEGSSAGGTVTVAASGLRSTGTNPWSVLLLPSPLVSVGTGHVPAGGVLSFSAVLPDPLPEGKTTLYFSSVGSDGRSVVRTLELDWTGTPDPDPDPDPDPTTTPDPGPTSTPDPDPTSTPSPEPSPLAVLTIVLDAPLGAPLAGAPVSVTGAGFEPGSEYNLTMYSVPTLIAEGTVGGSGAVLINAALPLAIEPGVHRLVFVGTSNSGERIERELVFVVTSTGMLAFTGASVGPALAFAILLILVGTTLEVSRRRRIGPA